MISLLILLFISLSLQDSQIFPLKRVVKSGDFFQIGCMSSLKPEYTDLWHIDTSGNHVQVYDHLSKSFHPNYKNDCSVNFTKDWCFLVFTTAKPMFAGSYFCVLDEKSSTNYSEIIIIESIPSCLSNISASGNIGFNPCFLTPELIQFSCSVKYYGNIMPTLKWKNVKGIYILNTNNTISNGIYNISEIVLLSPYTDGQSFECFVENYPYQCATAKLNVLYNQCATNDSIKPNLPCQFTNNEQLKNGANLSHKNNDEQSKSSNYIDDSRFLKFDHFAIIGICFGIVSLFALVFFLIIFLRRRCFLSQLNDRPHTDIPLLNTDPNVFKDNNGLHDKLDSSDIVSTANHMDGNQTIDDFDSGYHDQVNQISGNQVNNAASISYEGFNASRAGSDLKKFMHHNHIINLQSPIAEEETYDSLASSQNVSLTCSLQENPEKGPNDKNFVNLMNQDQSDNHEIISKYKELNNFLAIIYHFLTEQSRKLFSYILSNLSDNGQIDLMLILGIILNKIKKEKGMTEETYKMIQNNFGDIIKQMYLTPQMNMTRNEEKVEEFHSSGIDTESIDLRESGNN